MGWALLIQLGAVVATAVALVALAVLIGPALVSPVQFLSSFAGLVAAVCGIEFGEVAMAAIFLAGFHQVHSGRHEYGLAHAHSVDRAFVYLTIFAVLAVAGGVYTVVGSVLAPSIPEIPVASFFTGNVVIAPLSALFAGLALRESVRSVAEPGTLRRLRTALVLGVAGAIAGPLLNALAMAPGPQYVSAIVAGLLVSAIAGDGVAAISLLLFLLAFREVRRALLAGRPAPVLPRFPYMHPYAWMPANVGVSPPGQGPLPPPKP